MLATIAPVLKTVVGQEQTMITCYRRQRQSCDHFIVAAVPLGANANSVRKKYCIRTLAERALLIAT